MTSETRGDKVTIFALVLCGLGAIVAACNFYLWFIRFPLYLRRGSTKESFQFISIFPLLGSLLFWLAAFIFYRNGHHLLTWIAIAVSCFDTGGPFWFIGCVVCRRQ